MSTDLEAKIDILQKQVQENNKILRELRSRGKWAIIFSVVKWFIYILILVGTYNALKPFLDQFIATYASIQEGADSLANLKANAPSFNFDSLKEYFK